MFPATNSDFRPFIVTSFLSALLARPRAAGHSTRSYVNVPPLFRPVVSVSTKRLPLSTICDDIYLPTTV